MRRQPQGQHWLTCAAELVGVGLWVVGLTTLAVLPDTGVFLPVHPPMCVGLKVVAAWRWLLVAPRVGGAQRRGTRRSRQRGTRASQGDEPS